MTDWSLEKLLASLHEVIHQRLSIARQSFAHPGTKGNACESVWLQLLNTYLPQRYKASSAHIVDSQGHFSQQIDVAIYDRQYSPFIFQYEGQDIVPAESVYAVFEAKQTVNASLIGYAQDKVASVRKLCRTSLPIPHAGGTYPAKVPSRILGGILSLESDWSPPLGQPLIESLSADVKEGQLDLGCVAAHGAFALEGERYAVSEQPKAATAFLFELIARLQSSATVPMIDVRAYAKWLL
jgi:hypothetical protein